MSKSNKKVKTAHATPSGPDYQPKNILLTGGAGFIGSHVVRHLVKKYPHYNIISFDVLDYCASTKNLEDVLEAPNHHFIKGNILESDFVSHILEDKKIDTIMHFAAQSHVDNSFGNSFHFTKTNVLGTHVLLEAARCYGKIRRFIHVSTDEVYGETGGDLNDKSEHNMYDENALLNPTNPYSASKAAAEFIVTAYNHSWNLPIIITRGNNVYGPSQYPEKVIPKFICLLNQKRPCTIHGEGKNQRSFIYVEDVASAFDKVLHKGTIGEIYNIGTSREISTLTVAESLIKLFGLENERDKYITFVENRPFNDARYFIDYGKLRALGWEPKITWEEGLRRCKEWYCSRDLETIWPTFKNALKAHPKLNLGE